MAQSRGGRGPTAEPTTPLEHPSDALALRLLGPGIELEVAVPARGALTLGRAADNDVVVDHPSVSRHHARLRAADLGGVELEALATTNPVQFGGRRLAAGDRVALACGDTFAVGALVGVIGPARDSTRPVPVLPAGAIVLDPAMIQLYEIVARIAVGDVPVLVEGETGAGKEMVAHTLHLGSRRAARPFVRINCGALPTALIASELFGHVRGAFTGADHDKVGLIASADGGSVFLDEIGELPLALQATLLRVIEDGALRPVGATTTTPIDVRWIAATNRALADEVAAGRFRKDLYYRLQGFAIAVPPLRTRPLELRAIARSLATPHGLTEKALAALERHSWPGNVRELRNTIESAALLAGPAPIDVTHLPAAIDRPDLAAPTPASPSPSRSLRGDLADEERRRIVQALQRTDGNQTRAAELLGMPRRTLVKRMRQYRILRGRIVPND